MCLQTSLSQVFAETFIAQDSPESNCQRFAVPLGNQLHACRGNREASFGPRITDNGKATSNPCDAAAATAREVSPDEQQDVRPGKGARNLFGGQKSQNRNVHIGALKSFS